jgi:hypothetical protein
VCEPYEFEKENASTGEIELVKKVTDCINEDRSLMKYVKLFLSTNKGEDKGDEDEDEDAMDNSSGDDDSVENGCNTLN